MSSKSLYTGKDYKNGGHVDRWQEYWPVCELCHPPNGIWPCNCGKCPGDRFYNSAAKAREVLLQHIREVHRDG